jgi:predicted adenylyl cyclase CyaB
MREIEIKAQVESLASIREALQERGAELSDPVIQHDVVWGLPGITGNNEAPWLRLRTETKNNTTYHVFTLKRSVTGQLDSIEHETEIKDPVELASIVRELGFTLYADTTKTRQKTKLGDIEFCLDSVKDLGEFIEAEKLTEEEVDYEEVVAQLWKIFEEFGVTRTSGVTDGYDTLMNKKLGKE